MNWLRVLAIAYLVVLVVIIIALASIEERRYHASTIEIVKSWIGVVLVALAICGFVAVTILAIALAIFGSL